MIELLKQYLRPIHYDLLIEAKPLIDESHEDEYFIVRGKANKKLRILKKIIWRELQDAFTYKKEPKIYDAVKTVFSISMFTKQMQDPERAAYLFTKPIDEIAKMQYLYELGLDYYEQVLNMDEVDEEGNVNATMVNTKLKVIDMVSKRIHGMPTQNINQKVLSITQKDPISALDNKLDELQQIEPTDHGTRKEIESRKEDT